MFVCCWSQHVECIFRCLQMGVSVGCFWWSLFETYSGVNPESWRSLSVTAKYTQWTWTFDKPWIFSIQNMSEALGKNWFIPNPSILAASVAPLYEPCEKDCWHPTAHSDAFRCFQCCPCNVFALTLERRGMPPWSPSCARTVQSASPSSWVSLPENGQRCAILVTIYIYRSYTHQYNSIIKR